VLGHSDHVCPEEPESPPPNVALKIAARFPRRRPRTHTGEPVSVTSGCVGLDVRRAARVCAAGHGGQILVSQTVKDLVALDKRDTGSRTLMLGTSYGSYRGLIVRVDFRAGELCREDRSCLFAPVHVAC
jgi:hypothetical protein